MATIPSQPLGEFKADTSLEGSTTVINADHNPGCMAIFNRKGLNHFTYITREQAMAFFDLMPRKPLSYTKI